MSDDDIAAARSLDELKGRLDRELEQIIRLLKENEIYLKEKLSPEKQGEIISRIVNVFLSSVDPYGSYFSQSGAKPLDKNELAVYRKGIALGTYADKGVFVRKISGKSPAATAGLRNGDYIISINGDRVFTKEEAAEKLRVNVMPWHTLIVRRGAHEYTIRIPPGEAVWTDFSSTKINNAAYIWLYGVREEKTPDYLHEALRAHANDPDVSYLVLDLRHNLGGGIIKTKQILSLLVTGDEKNSGLFLLRDKYGKAITQKREKTDFVFEKPVCVLVNKYTASAAEIIAGVLREKEDAVLIGEKTYGKGTAQTKFYLSGGNSIYITEYSWHLPSGASVKTGLVPDVILGAGQNNIPRWWIGDLKHDTALVRTLKNSCYVR